MSSFIPIKKIRKRQHNGEQQEFYAVPSVAIATPQGRKLIPNPAGNEAGLFPTLEEAEDAIRRAGFDYEFEGKKTQLYSAVSTSHASKSSKKTTSGQNPMDAAVPLLIAHLRDREGGVVANAVFALGAIRAYPALDQLIEILGHDDPTVRKNLAEAIARLGGSALPRLKDAFEQAQKSTHKNAPYIRLTVLSTFLEFLDQGQGVLYSDHFLPLAVSALEDESWLVRAQAAQVIY